MHTRCPPPPSPLQLSNHCRKRIYAADEGVVYYYGDVVIHGQVIRLHKLLIVKCNKKKIKGFDVCPRYSGPQISIAAANGTVEGARDSGN